MDSKELKLNDIRVHMNESELELDMAINELSTMCSLKSGQAMMLLSKISRIYEALRELEQKIAEKRA